ncbi:MAG TPA: RNA methyltransferase [Methylomirabilota bacterium]|nr:RNA methyltransferase [Methylomirabilota bacterium]
MVIHDRDDPRIADYRDAIGGGAADTFTAEGRLVVRRLLEGTRYRARSVLLTPAALGDLTSALAAQPPSLAVFVASPAVIRAVVGFKFHHGCLALGERGQSAVADEIVAPEGPRVLVVLEELADPDNVGTVFRNSAAFGAGGVLLSPGCADPLYRKTLRVSMGATLSVPFARAELAAGVPALRAAGYTLVALTPDRGAEDIAAAAGRGWPSARLALLLGAEGAGLSEAARRTSDFCVRIPMAPGVDSLNVATACGIALHRLAGSRSGGMMGRES